MAKPSKYPDWPGVIDRKKASGLKLYFRFKAGGEKQLPPDMESEEFAAAYEECRLLDQGPEPVKTKDKTFNDAWLAYQASDYFRKLDHKTKGRHDYYATTFLDASLKPGGKSTFRDVPLKSPDEELLPLLRRYIKNAPADLPYRTACLLRKLYAIAIEIEEWGILRNLGNDLKIAKPQSKGGHKEWDIDLLARYESFHQSNDMALASYGLARFLGNRRGDVALLRWDQLTIVHEIVDGAVVEVWYFDFRQRKNQNRTGGQEMFLPVPDDLRTILERPRMADSRANGGTIIKNEWGTGFTINSMGNKFRDWCDLASIPAGYTLHGLRANFASELANAGVDLFVLTDAMGHSSPSTTTTYLKGRQRFDSARKMREAREKQAKQQAQILDFKRSLKDK
jgi:integrase